MAKLTCPECGRSDFAKPQGLGAHRARAHGYRSPTFAKREIAKRNKTKAAAARVFDKRIRKYAEKQPQAHALREPADGQQRPYPTRGRGRRLVGCEETGYLSDSCETVHK